MASHLKQYLVYIRLLALNNQVGSGTLDFFLKNLKNDIKEKIKEENLKNDIKEIIEEENLIYMEEINKMYVAKPNQYLIYGKSIYDHQIIYIKLNNGIQFSMIIED
jgi:hypothetical protein